MHVHPPVWHSFHQVTLAEDALGDRAPLVHVLRRYASAAGQLTVTVAITLASALLVVAGVAAAVPLLAGAAVAAIGFALRLTTCAMERHEQVLELIVAERAGVPLAIVQREAARLVEPEHRTALARTYEDMGRPPERSGQVPHPACVVAVPDVVAKVRPELRRIAGLLRGDDPPARGVAAAESLLCESGSSLFGRDVGRLRQDLGRVAYLLSSKP